MTETATEDYLPGAVGGAAGGFGLRLYANSDQPAAPGRSAQSRRPVVFSNPLEQHQA
jgi:hypothetical protein